jgi:multicomponent Na+:H+ antiporter subunit E
VRAKHVVWLGLLLLWVWHLWSGHYGFLTEMLSLASVALVLVVAVRGRTPDEEGSPLAWFHQRTVVYIPWLLLEIVKANVDVSKRILNPSLPIQRRLIRARSTQKTAVGRVVLANSITLTPGTVSVIVNDDEIIVHALCDDAAGRLLTGEMDERVTRWEGGN